MRRYQHLSLAHKPKYNILLLGIIAVVLALAGIYVVFKSHAATSTADINSDGVVDVRDLAILAANFRKTGQNFAQGDLNGDGTVDIQDFSLLALNWGLSTGGTGGGGSSCASFFTGITTATNFPCPANTGVPAGVTLKVATHSSTACTNCPAGVTWDASHGYTVPSCTATGGSQVVVDGWSFNEQVALRASNGNKLGGGLSEAATKALACVVFTRDLFAPADAPGHLNNNVFGIATGLPSSGGGDAICPSYPCGPVFVSDSEISMPVSVNGYDYGISATNWALWRVYSHGTSVASQCNGWCDVHDSYLAADRDGGGSHMDGLISNGNSSSQTSGARPMVLDHNTMLCAETNPGDETAGGGCSGDLGLYSDSTLSGWINTVSVTNNLFLPVPSGHVCAYTGQDQPAKGGTGYNITFANNVWVKTSASGSCASAPIDNWDSSTAASPGPPPVNDKWCNNLYDDGTKVDSSAETGGCP